MGTYNTLKASRSGHLREAVQVHVGPGETWCPVRKVALPDGHQAKSCAGAQASRVYDETWEIQGGRLARKE